MADQFKEETIDTYLEHSAYHQEFHSDCSSCYKERRLLQAHRTVNTAKLKEELGTSINQWKVDDINRNPNPLDQ